MKKLSLLVVLLTALLQLHCSEGPGGTTPGTQVGGAGGGGGPAGGGGAAPAGGAALPAACNNFGGSVDVTASVYSCVGTGNSTELHFDGNGGFAAFTIDNLGQTATPIGNGTYQIANGQIRIQIPTVALFDNNGDGTIDPYDETSTEARVRLGMLASFQTIRTINGQQFRTMACGAIAHTLDQNTSQLRYGCPLINIITNGREIVYDQQPKIEFQAFDCAQGSPTYRRPQAGNLFVSLQANQNTNNDYHGIYRQVGNNFCTYFPSVDGGYLAVVTDGPRFPNEFLTVDDNAFRTGRAGQLQSCVRETPPECI